MTDKNANYLVILAGAAIVSIFLFSHCSNSSNDKAPAGVVYKDPQRPVEERVEDLLGRMTLEEKVRELSGLNFTTVENKRLGIPPLVMSDGPVGVRWGFATAFPAGVSIAAAWNPELTEKIGAAIAKEMKSKGRNHLLGPCVNIHRFPLGGRNFESYGEDPFLAARTAVAFIKGVQSENVVACVKHYACNNQEWQRHRVDVGVDERGLREIYLPAFKAAVKEANVWSVMAAYNRFRGHYCCENEYLLNEVLKKEWGFQGFVVSDWGGTKSTVKAAETGLDLEMPSGKFFGEKLLDAVKKGDVSEAVIDDKVRRLLRVRFQAGLFDTSHRVDETVIHSDAHKQLARQAAGEGMVLMKNNSGLLPLDVKKIKSIAVIGPNAATARTGGGGSSMVVPVYGVSPLQGLKNAVGNRITIQYAPGITMRGDILALDTEYLLPDTAGADQRGLKAVYFRGSELKGRPDLSRIDARVDFIWGYDVPHPELYRENDWNRFSVRWTGKLSAPKTGVYKLNAMHTDGMRVYLDDKLIIDNWKSNPLRFKSVPVQLQAGNTYPLRIEYMCDGGLSIVKFGWELPDHDYLAEATELAKGSDVAIVFTGLSARFESESFDRQRLELPNQDVLIEAVTKANPNTVVVLETGSPVTMEPWLENISALVQAWYPGQEGGNAIADVLLGKYNPGGKLPVSFIKSYDHCPAFKDYKDKSFKSPYSEGLFVGYRYLDKHKLEPLFPFGHGLSYTSFEYKNLSVEPVADEAGAVMVNVDIINTGQRKGAEVVQVYVKDMECSLERPEKELKGFRKILLEPGESKRVSIKLGQDAFAYYHPGKKQWVVEPGEFEIRVGSSSKDVKLRSLVKSEG
jgi:beta-glucosidase